MSYYFVSQLWNWQWLHYIGIAITVLSTLYLAGDYLDDKYLILKVLTESITFGLIIAFFYAFEALLGNFLQLVSYLIFFRILDPHQVDVFLKHIIGTQSILLNGVIVGFTIGFAYSLWRIYANKLPIRNYVAWLVAIGVVSECVGLLSYHIDLLSSVCAEIGGFTLGLAIAQLRLTPQRLILLWLLFGFVLIGPLIYLIFFVGFAAYTPTNIFILGFIDTYRSIAYQSFYPFVIALTLYNFAQPHVTRKPVTRKYFLAWFVGASILALGVWLFMHIVYRNVTEINNLSEITLYYLLAIGIVNGHGDHIIKQVKMRYAYMQQNSGQGEFRPLVNTKRFKTGLIIGVLYTVPFAIYIAANDLISSDNVYIAPNHLISLGKVPFFLGFPLTLSYVIENGLLIGCLYGFGPRILYLVENLSKRRLGQLGLALSLLLIVVTEYAH